MDNRKFKRLVRRVVSIVKELTDDEYQELWDGHYKTFIRLASHRFGQSYLNNLDTYSLLDAIEIALGDRN